MSASDKKDELSDLLSQVARIEQSTQPEAAPNTLALCLLIRVVVAIWGRVEK